jgi:formylglycine-generating enzyme required for sulfatase activity
MKEINFQKKLKTLFFLPLILLILFIFYHARNSDHAFSETILREMVLIEEGKISDVLQKIPEFKDIDREVFISAFYIDKYEVTNRDYEKFDSEHVRSKHSTQDQQPVVNVSWWDAIAYCNWRSQQEQLDVVYDLDTGEADLTRNGYRLPTEAEWIKAAFGNEAQSYPWGNEPFNGTQGNFADRNFQDYNSHFDQWITLNYDIRAVDDGHTFTASVGSYPEGMSPYGVHDMLGNVMEWVHDWYHPEYYKNYPKMNPSGPKEGMTKILWGSSWYHTPDGHTTKKHGQRFTEYSPETIYSVMGFRCVRQLGES